MNNAARLCAKYYYKRQRFENSLFVKALLRFGG